MTLTASIALLSAGIAGAFAILALLFARAPGWRDQRLFSLAAFSGAGFSALDIPTNTGIFADEVVVACSHVQFALAALHSIAWLRYSSTQSGAAGGRLDRVGTAVLAVLGAAGALTPLFLTGAVRKHAFPPLGALYRTAEPTALGDLAYAVIVLALLVPIGRFVAAWRRGASSAAVQFVALAALVVMGAHDTAVVAGAYTGPYLLDVAFLLPAAAVGGTLASRFVAAARAHEALRHDLEGQVAQRTAELGRTQEALHRSEKLAALGQFAAGVAHEVNNPAAVVGANLLFLAEQERDGLSPSALDAVHESITAVQRISGIVRRLVDAGRLAASDEPRQPVGVKRIGDSAIAAARARFGRRVWMGNLVPEAVGVLAQEGVLAQVLANLVVNAVQAIGDRRTDGRVIVRAEPEEAGRVRIVVQDNGPGMPPEVLRRCFEPFFTTKPFGSGTGLGLAVSRGLVLGLGGDLRLESEPGVGTRAIIELAAAAAPLPPEAPSPAAVRPARLEMLIVDDEAPVLSSLRRLLELRYGVELASSVEDGLARLGRRTFDVVLCDVMMPSGGGERLYRTLVSRSPELARRVVFFTGGAVTEDARHFLSSQPQPVLTKPLDLDQLARVTAELSPHH